MTTLPERLRFCADQDGVSTDTHNELIECAEIVELIVSLLAGIADMGGKTLIRPLMGEEYDRAHQEGATTAFNQASSIARGALKRARGEA